MLKSTPKTFPQTKPTQPARNSGMFSHGVSGGKQKLDPQPHPQRSNLTAAIENHSRKRPNPQKITIQA